ncbi:DUF1176 domain-containing protein [Shinella sp. CPCC 101442]|uniref:DUF1176 domain-containing protein n=1 Tax=Shinella sp. CPCC 101442 TaxID=2932265 RepID=UPI00215311B9|nr:DUF1176 domain-containing protein [Shinella sp. CPCC 101442]MCR6499681.1 DUF1176 domain-containing protein [Shinella sp. CPCC 101442]
MKILLAALFCAALPLQSLAAERPEGIAAAETLVKTAFGTECDMNGMEEVPMAGPDEEGYGHAYYRLAFKPDYDPNGPEVQIDLYQLFCGSGAYNIRHAFVLKRSDEESLKLISFATPDLDYAYADEEMNTLKADPKVRGFRATGLLVNSSFDVEKRTITSHAAWRGIGDAWDSGEWVFRNGDFMLTRFEVDPTYGDPDPAAESFVVYEAGK